MLPGALSAKTRRIFSLLVKSKQGLNNFLFTIVTTTTATPKGVWQLAVPIPKSVNNSNGSYGSTGGGATDHFEPTLTTRLWSVSSFFKR
jgi:hypothetical protein